MSERNPMSQRNAARDQSGPNRGADQRLAGGARNNERQSRGGNTRSRSGARNNRR